MNKTKLRSEPKTPLPQSPRHPHQQAHSQAPLPPRTSRPPNHVAAERAPNPTLELENSAKLVDPAFEPRHLGRCDPERVMHVINITNSNKLRQVVRLYSNVVPYQTSELLIKSSPSNYLITCRPSSLLLSASLPNLSPGRSNTVLQEGAQQLSLPTLLFLSQTT